MFSGLDNFLNGNNNLNLIDTPETPLISSINDSFDLDISDFGAEQKSQKLKNGKDSKKYDAQDDSDSEMAVSYVPIKGQKAAAKRLKKIGDTLKCKMAEVKRIQVQKERLASQKKSPSKKKTNKRRPPTRRTVDSDSSDSISDEPSTSHQSYNRNVIVLDCDDEFIGGPAVNLTRNIAAATAVSVEECKDLKVSVRVNGTIKHFFMNKFQKLSSIIGKISEEKNVPSDHVRLMFQKNTVYEYDTPHTINYVQGLVLQAHISDMASKSKPTAKSSTNESTNKMEIKIQAEGRKRPFITYIGPSDQLMKLAFACAEEFQCDIDRVAIEFDGEFINFKETADDLGLEGGEILDFYEKKK